MIFLPVNKASVDTRAYIGSTRGAANMHKPMTTRLDINLYIDNYKTKGKQMKYIHTLSRIKLKKTRKKGK